MRILNCFEALTNGWQGESAEELRVGPLGTARAPPTRLDVAHNAFRNDISVILAASFVAIAEAIVLARAGREQLCFDLR